MNPISSIFYCGHMVREKDGHMIYRPNGSGEYFFLYFPQGMYVTYQNEEILLQNNACVFYGPSDYQCFRGTPTYISSYVHFHAPPYIKKLNIPFARPFYPQNYHILNQLVLEMQRESIVKDPFSTFLADLALQKLLYLAARDFLTDIVAEPKDKEIRQRFEQLRVQMIANCSYPWTIETLAANMAMSRSCFYDYYKQFFHISPKADLIEARMQKAKRLLMNEAMTVHQAASESGFENISHFTRYYKKYFGHSPSYDLKNKASVNEQST